MSDKDKSRIVVTVEIETEVGGTVHTGIACGEEATFAEVFLGLVKCRDELTRQIEQRNNCPMSTEVADEEAMLTMELGSPITRKEGDAALTQPDLSSGSDVLPEAPANPHNPDALTDSQIGIADGWRLLDEDEVGTGTKILGGLRELDMYYRSNQQWQSFNSGCDKGMTYRTRLSRAELRKARGLESEARRVDMSKEVERQRQESAEIEAERKARIAAVTLPQPVPTEAGGTPETDAHHSFPGTRSGLLVERDFARTLERQRNALQAQLTTAIQKASYLRDDNTRLEQERDKAIGERDATQGRVSELEAVLQRANPPPERAYECLEMLDAAGMGKTDCPHGNTLTGMVKEICERLATERTRAKEVARDCNTRILDAMAKAEQAITVERGRAETAEARVRESESLSDALAYEKKNVLVQLASANAKLAKVKADREAAVASIKITETAIAYWLTVNKEVNKLPAGNFYLPETLDGFLDAARKEPQ